MEPVGAPTALTAASPLIISRDLCVGYPDRSDEVCAVDAASFSVERGERIVLLGPSGCGKSSILKVLAGFLRPVSGTLAINGREVEGPGPDRIVVFQEFDQLLPWKTVLQNVVFPLRTVRGFGRAAATEIAYAALDSTGLLDAANSYPYALSGGMKQRAAIARAIAMQPDILLMDEPFASLDPASRRGLQIDVLRLTRDHGITLIFVTHSIEEALLMGNRLLLLKGRPASVVANLEVGGFTHLDVETSAFRHMVQRVSDLLFGRDVRV